MYKRKISLLRGLGWEKENAYFSLEACIIMPLVFYSIIFLMYVGFYQYDKCILQQDVFRMLIRGSQTKFLSNEELAQKMKEEDAQWYYDKYVLCSWNDKKIEVGYGEICIKQQAVLNASVPIIMEWTGMEFWDMSMNFSSTRIHPVKTIRSCRKLEKLAERREENEGMGVYSFDEP